LVAINKDLILNTIVCLAEFSDGCISEYAVNIIAEPIYNQINDDGYGNMLFEDIIGREYQQPLVDTHKNAVSPSAHSKTTEGWKI
jgi:hypothetical protein